MRFRPDNKIRYGQDHCFYRGIPSGVEFQVERFGDSMYRLTGHGYGVLGEGSEAYGNGQLYVWGLTARQRERFERHV